MLQEASEESEGRVIDLEGEIGDIRNKIKDLRSAEKEMKNNITELSEKYSEVIGQYRSVDSLFHVAKSSLRTTVVFLGGVVTVIFGIFLFSANKIYTIEEKAFNVERTVRYQEEKIVNLERELSEARESLAVVDVLMKNWLGVKEKLGD